MRNVHFHIVEILKSYISKRHLWKPFPNLFVNLDLKKNIQFCINWCGDNSPFIYDKYTLGSINSYLTLNLSILDKYCLVRFKTFMTQFSFICLYNILFVILFYNFTLKSNNFWTFIFDTAVTAIYRQRASQK